MDSNHDKVIQSRFASINQFTRGHDWCGSPDKCLAAAAWPYRESLITSRSRSRYSASKREFQHNARLERRIAKAGVALSDLPPLPERTDESSFESSTISRAGR